MTKVDSFNKKNKNRIIYSNILSAIMPALHSGNIHVAVPPKTLEILLNKIVKVFFSNKIKIYYEPPTTLNLPKESLH